MNEKKFFKKASAALERGNWQKAIDLLEPIKNELTIEWKGHLALAYLYLDKYEEPIALLEPVITDLDLQGKSNLALAYLYLDKYEETIALLEPIKDKLSPAGKSNLAAAYNSLGQYDKTIAFLELLKKSLIPNGKNNLAVAYNGLGQYDKTIDLLELLIADLDLQAKSNLAAAYNGLGQYSKTVELLELLKYKLHLPGKSNLATAYLYLGQVIEAIEFITETEKPLLTALFITELLTYLKSTILSPKKLPWLEDPIIKREIVALFFNTYLERNLSKKIRYAQQTSLFSQICILALLKFDDIPTLGYYCSAKAYTAMFKPPEKDATAAKENTTTPKKDEQDSVKLRMTAVSQFNDPLEGKMLSHNGLGINKEAKIFIKCFSLRINNLNQFRLYGGENGQADGVNLVFKPTFFNRELSIYSEQIANRLDGSKSKKPMPEKSMPEKSTPSRLPLFRVCYLGEALSTNEKTYQIYGLAKEDTVDYFLKHPGHNYQNYLTEVIDEEQKLIVALKKFLKVVTTIQIPYLPYLFKHKAFLDEAECRIIHLNQPKDSSPALDENGHWVYVPYEVPVLGHLKEVYFGPKTKDAFFLSQYLPPEYDIKCYYESTLPFKEK